MLSSACSGCLGRLFALQELQDRRCGRGGLLDLRKMSGLREGLDPRHLAEPAL